MRFNNIDFTEHFKVEEIRRSLNPPINNLRTKIPGHIGSRFIKSILGEEIIEVDIRLIEETRLEVQEKAREIAGLLVTKEPERLELHDEPNRFNMAILNGNTDLEKFLYTGFATLEFTCLDPLSYSKEKNTVNLGPSTSINNKGTYETTGVITVDISNNINFLEVLLLDTGEKVYIEDGFISGDKVDINLESESVKKNNILIMDKVHIDSDFFKIPKGEFIMNLSSGSGMLEFRKAWL